MRDRGLSGEGPHAGGVRGRRDLKWYVILVAGAAVILLAGVAVAVMGSDAKTVLGEPTAGGANADSLADGSATDAGDSPSSGPGATTSATPTPGRSTTARPAAGTTTRAPGGGAATGGPPPPANTAPGCAGNPASCGYPTPATAGLPAGTALAVISGGLTVSTDGAVVDGKEIHGCVTVAASNVTIRNSRIIGPCAYGIDNDSGSGTVIDRVEINCTDGHGTGINGPSWSAHAVYIHDCENGLEINSNATITDSVISAREGDPSAHGDGIQSQAGTNVTIRHNTLLEVNPVTSAIITNPTADSGWLVENNFLGGGAFTVYCPEQGTNFTVRNNRFVPAKLAGSPYSAAYGLTDACNHTGITWTGNFRDTDLGLVGPNS